MSSSEINLSKAEHIFEEVKSKMYSLKSDLEEVEKDFAALDKAHQALLAVKSGI
ncbi:hypothetical protein [Borrelia sp. HM]|uniref:hypothetical protein n=1 Tax=Borrelia sp. HM TaxID=1882662 RepID=UPI001C7E8A4F|nr:hypothetical protein [Borrelia sp. HM]